MTSRNPWGFPDTSSLQSPSTVDGAHAGKPSTENGGDDFDRALAARAAECAIAPDTFIDAAAAEETFEARMLEFARLFPDFEEAVISLDDSPLPPPFVIDFIKRANSGVRVLYHLAKNRQLLSKITDLNEADALAELRALGASLTPAPEPSAWSWWAVGQFERTATPAEKRAAEAQARLYAWEPDTQPH